MTYARIPPLGASASASIQANTAGLIPDIQSSLPQMPGMPPITSPEKSARQIIESSPIAEDIASDWGPAIGIAGKIGIPSEKVMNDPGAAVTFMMQAMPVVLEAAGISGDALDYVTMASKFAPEIGALVDGRPKPIVFGLVKTGAAYGCQQLGIPPELGTATIDVIRAGEISDETFEAAGGMGGAIGGSALCSLVGIPPCIGGFAGGIAGKAVGGFVASLGHIGSSKAEKDKERAERQRLEAQITGELNAIRRGYEDAIRQWRPSWWAQVDGVIDGFNAQWQALECGDPAHGAVGTRFPLLWSGQGTVNPYFVYPYSSSTCTVPINRNLSRGTGCLNSKGLLVGMVESGCPQPYGCPYPGLPVQGAPNAFAARVIQAFAAYDIWWVPPEGRDQINQGWVDYLSKPNERPIDPTTRNRGMFAGKTWTQGIADVTAAKSKCSTHACRVQADKDLSLGYNAYKSELAAKFAEAVSLEHINAAALRISTDLTSSAATYAAAQQINASRSAAIQGGYGKLLASQTQNATLIIKKNQDLLRARTHGRLINRVVNYGALALGGALLVGALAKRS